MKCKFKVGDVIDIEFGRKKRIIKVCEDHVICNYIGISEDGIFRHSIQYINHHELIPGFGTKLYKALS